MKRAECISHREPHVPEQAPYRRITLPVTLKYKGPNPTKLFLGIFVIYTNMFLKGKWPRVTALWWFAIIMESQNNDRNYLPQWRQKHGGDNAKGMAAAVQQRRSGRASQTPLGNSGCQLCFVTFRSPFSIIPRGITLTIYACTPCKHQWVRTKIIWAWSP